MIEGVAFLTSSNELRDVLVAEHVQVATHLALAIRGGRVLVVAAGAKLCRNGHAEAKEDILE